VDSYIAWHKIQSAFPRSFFGADQSTLSYLKPSTLHLIDLQSLPELNMPERTVLITGCSDGGLGAAMAKAYRAKGFRVFATLRDVGKAGSLVDAKGIEILPLEVTSEESIRQCAKTIDKLTGGSLDILVNNAGRSGAMPLLDVSIDSAKKMYDLNVWAVLAMVQAFAPMLIKSQGTICNISSVSSELTFAWSGML
jgi:NAD(P)-dependent dehydrogenase (short-subunit alcohol dehydrogenase family)